MSIFIKGMKMPKNCKECIFADMDDVDFDHKLVDFGYELYCIANKKYADLDMYDHPIGWKCPIIEVSTPHGRLGDLDALVKTLEQNRLCYVSDIDDESFELADSVVDKGDEVKVRLTGSSYLVTNADSVLGYGGINTAGRVFLQPRKDIVKTGRHFDSVDAYLKGGSYAEI